ncbi:MAG: ABC transporter permease [Spirochaetota bacterium]
MKSRWILFVSARHFRTKRREKGHTAGILSVLGIAAGVMTLIAVLAVMNGFQFGTIEDILEVGSFHLQVSVPESDGDAATVGELAESISGVRGVRAAVPYAETYGLAYGYFPDPLAVLLRVVPRDLPSLDQRFAENLEIVSGSWDLGGTGVVLGRELARRMGARVGDVVEIVGFSGALVAGGAETTELELVGIFRSGFLEYDAGWGFVGLGPGAAALGIDGPERVGVKLHDRFGDRAAMRRIEARAPDGRNGEAGESNVGLSHEIVVESWRDYNRAIFGALRLEKVLMMVLIGLIFVVVAVNIYQSLRRSVVERTEEIGVLKAIGAPPLPLQLVFVLEGLWIGLAGGGVGMVLGILVASNINGLFRAAELVINALASVANWTARLFARGAGDAPDTFSIFSPAYFYIDEVPAVVVPAEVASIVAFAVVSATVAAYIASRRVSAIAPASVLRYE